MKETDEMAYHIDESIAKHISEDVTPAEEPRTNGWNTFFSALLVGVGSAIKTESRREHMKHGSRFCRVWGCSRTAARNGILCYIHWPLIPKNMRDGLYFYDNKRSPKTGNDLRHKIAGHMIIDAYAVSRGDLSKEQARLNAVAMRDKFGDELIGEIAAKLRS